MKKQARLLGIAASLRNARWGIGNQKLIDALKEISTEKELFNFLTEESELHLENFLDAGRREGKGFHEIYKNLKRNKGNKGLSNSEVALAAALWAAHKRDVEIDHLSLSEYFPASGRKQKIDELKEKLILSDGILIAGPVYFGDRSSLAQELINMIREDINLCHKLKGKIYGGIAVGAKRNGGQETTLIYQLLDVVSLGLLGVGNDSDTTAQYGGTGHAGDIGTMSKDNYGLQTSMGTGRRVANLIRKFNCQYELKGPVKILFLVLQDSKDLAKRKIKDIISICGDKIDPKIIDISSKKIKRCIACDICPTYIDLDEVYRCIIKSNDDEFESLHKDLLNYDAIMPVVVSTNDLNSIESNYQIFIERTRYLRRGDYVFSDILTTPLTFEELGIRDRYSSIRLITSLIRHHTIIASPITGYIHQGKLLNSSQVVSDFKDFVDSAKQMTLVRLAKAEIKDSVKYNPVGYVLSSNKDVEDVRLEKRKSITKYRTKHLISDANKRLRTNPS